ncbi:MAG: hydroxyacid dehydrogenase [Candidatus Nanopelagicales bacterium]
MSILIVEDVYGPPFAALADVVYEPTAFSSDELLTKLLVDAEALVVRNRTQVNPALLEKAPNLKLVARAGVGLDNIDIPACNERGIAVVAGLGANAVSVGELAVGLALSVARQVTLHHQAINAGQWNRTAGVELSGKTWGLIGCGATAKATAQLLAGFNMNLLGYDPFVSADDPTMKKLGISVLSLNEVLAQSDFVSIHVPANKETNHLINSDRLRLMKPTSILINVGRGEVVDEAALAAALAANEIAGAGLDVREVEPSDASKFAQFNNVVLTPHIAGITIESQERINQILADEITRKFSGQPLQYAVGAIKS